MLPHQEHVVCHEFFNVFPFSFGRAIALEHLLGEFFVICSLVLSNAILNHLVHVLFNVLIHGLEVEFEREGQLTLETWQVVQSFAK